MKRFGLTKADIILAIIFLITGCISPFVLQNSAGSGSSVTISLENRTIAECSLSENKTFYYKDGTISTEEIAEPDNVIVIENGSVYVKCASCEGQDCVKAGKISKEGRIIACLPHKLLISIESKESDVDVVLK